MALATQLGYVVPKTVYILLKRLISNGNLKHYTCMY